MARSTRLVNWLDRLGSDPDKEYIHSMGSEYIYCMGSKTLPSASYRLSDLLLYEERVIPTNLVY